MGTEEGAVGPGDAATGAAEYIRRHHPRSPLALDRGPMAGYLQISAKRIRASQLDGGPP